MAACAWASALASELPGLDRRSACFCSTWAAAKPWYACLAANGLGEGGGGEGERGTEGKEQWEKTIGV